MIDKEAVQAEEDAIRQEVAEKGRLPREQEDILYTIALRQDELGRQPTNMMESKIKGNPLYQELLDREYLTYEVFSNAINPDHNIASLYVTLKGMRYCIVYSDELSAQRPVDPAGARREVN